MGTSGALSTFPTRLLVAAAAIPLIVWLAMTGGYPFFAFVAVASTIALWEFYGLAEKKGARPLKRTGIFFGLLVNGVFVFDRSQPWLFDSAGVLGLPQGLFTMHQCLLVVLIAMLAVVALVELYRPSEAPIVNASTTIAGVTLISLFFGTLTGLRELFPYGFPVSQHFPVAIAGDAELETISTWGGYTVVVFLATIWICDTAAYVGGAVLGKHKLFERVSPGKTWEGGVAGFLAAILTFWAGTTWFLPYMDPMHGIFLGAVVGSVGQMGDLVESRFKRDAGVKDSSSILPGHGGIYDRFDSLVFLSPIVYLYIDFVVLS